MAKQDDISFFQDQITLSKKKLEKYVEKYDHNYKLYNGKDSPKSKIADSIQEPLNLVYPHIEMNRVELGFRYPKITVKANRRIFFIKKIRGQIERKILNPEVESTEIFKQMVMTGQKSLENIPEPNQDNPLEMDTVDYFILDGKTSAKISQKALNEFVSDKNVEEEFENCKNDALTTPAGAIWIDYYSPYYLPVSENEFTKTNEICVTSEKIGSTLLFDPSVKNLKNIHAAKWVGKKFFLSNDDLKALKFVKKDDGKPLFNQEIINRLIETPDASILQKYGECLDDESEFNNEEHSKDDRRIGYNFWQIWAKPSLVEQLDPKSKFKRGKMMYVIEGLKENVCDPIPWPNLTDEFPCEILAFNLSGNSLVPPSDIEIYESQLTEYNIFKALQRELADDTARIKMILNPENWSNASIEKIKDQLTNKRNQYIPVFGFKNTDVFQIIPNAGNTPLWTMDERVKNDINFSSMTSDAKAGMVKERASATGYAIADRASTTRSQARQYTYAKFCKKCIEKIHALMKQYYTERKMIQITGSLDPEWETFDRDSIQGEYDTQVDIMSMNPNDTNYQTQKMMEILNLMLGLLDNPKRYLKVLSEGKQVNISGLVESILDQLDFPVDNIFPEIDPMLADNAGMVLTTQIGTPETMSAMKGQVNAVPGAVQKESTNMGATGGGFIPAGEEMQDGGKPKVPPENQPEPTQGNNGGGRQ